MIFELLSITAAFCYTLSGIIAVFGMKDSNPTTATFISLLTNLAFLWPVALNFSPIVFDFGAIQIYAIAAAFAPVTGRLLSYLSLEKFGVSTTTAIRGVQPIIVTMLAYIFLSEHFPAIIYLVILITVIGISIIGSNPSSTSKERRLDKWKLILPLSSAFCYSSSNVARKAGLKVMNLPLLAAAITSSFSSAYLFLMIIFTRKMGEIKLTRSSLFFFVLSGLVNSLAWISSFQALNIGEASIVSTILGTQPLIAIALSYILLRKTEIITIRKVIGASIVVFGVVLISILN